MIRTVPETTRSVAVKFVKLQPGEAALVVDAAGKRSLAVADKGTVEAPAGCTVLVGTKAEIKAEIARRKADPAVKFTISQEHEDKVAK